MECSTHLALLKGEKWWSWIDRCLSIRTVISEIIDKVPFNLIFILGWCCTDIVSAQLCSYELWLLINLLPAVTWRRTRCLVTTFPRRAGCLAPTGSAPLRQWAPTTRGVTGRRRSTRLSTGAVGSLPARLRVLQGLGDIADDRSIMSQLPVSCPRRGQVVVPRGGHRLWHLPQGRTQTGETRARGLPENRCLFTMEAWWSDRICVIGLKQYNDTAVLYNGYIYLKMFKTRYWICPLLPNTI